MKKITSHVFPLYAYLLVGIYPLFMTNYYYNLQLSKALFFVIAVILCGFSLAIFRLFSCGQHTYPMVKLAVNLPVDLSVFLFGLSALISAFLSPYGRMAFTGEQGRFMGVGLILSMYICFFLCSHHHTMPKHLSTVTIISGLLVELLGILQFVSIDPLGLSSHVPPQLAGVYLSTLGNANIFSHYVSIIAVLSLGLYCLQSKKVYLVSSLISYVALFCSNSDGGFLGVTVMFFLFPLIMPPKGVSFLRLSEQYVLFSLSCLISNCLSPWAISSYSGIPRLLTGQWGPFLLLLLSVLFYLFSRYHLSDTNRLHRFRKQYTIFLLFGLSAGFFLFLGANLGIVSIPFLTITDHWGSDRGYIWKKVLYLWQNAPLAKKLFGYGPDTLKLLLIGTCYDEMISVTGKVFDSAHNSILQYLITTGLCGVIFYVVWCVSSLYTTLKAKKEEVLPWLAAFVVCLTQTMIMPDQPVTTPLMFMIIGICVGTSSAASPA